MGRVRAQARPRAARTGFYGKGFYGSQEALLQPAGGLPRDLEPCCL